MELPLHAIIDVPKHHHLLWTLAGQWRCSTSSLSSQRSLQRLWNWSSVKIFVSEKILTVDVGRTFIRNSCSTRTAGRWWLFEELALLANKALVALLYEDPSDCVIRDTERHVMLQDFVRAMPWIIFLKFSLIRGRQIQQASSCVPCCPFWWGQWP